jgi:membrane associated rhomboid family serine protease
MDDDPELVAPEESPPPRRFIAWTTYLIIASTVAVFLAQLHYSDDMGNDPLGDALAFSAQSWADGRYWTLLTYAWAHATAMFGQPGLFWLHIVANMVPLFCLGPALEDAVGHGRFLALYLGSAIVAALCWFALNSESPEPIIGASGAVFGVIAAAGVIAPRVRIGVLLFFIIPLRTTMGILALCICAAEAVQAVFHLMPEIAHEAHLGGAAFGALFALVCRRWPPPGRIYI